MKKVPQRPREIIVLFLFILLQQQAAAQSQKFDGSLELDGSAITGNVPLWLRANRFGSIPQPGLSVSAIGSVHKNYEVPDIDEEYPKLVDWGAGLQYRMNAGKEVYGTLIEGYVKGRLSIFQLKAGRDRNIVGLCDSTLGSGSFPMSGNALGVPSVELSIPEYFALPFFHKLFSVKGSISHGWLGKTLVQYGSHSNQLPTYFHQLTIYGFIGRDNWKVKLFGGINHQVFWGSEKTTYGSQFDLSPFQTYLYVLTGKTWNQSKLGNQLGSVDVALQYNFPKIDVFIYRQFLYDVGALAHFANMGDGLNGVRLVNKDVKAYGVDWKKMVFEVFLTKNQAGEPSSKITPSGDENYYNNDFYRYGWSYKGLALGNPLITTVHDAKKGQASDPKDYFISSRLLALHYGVEALVDDYVCTVKLSYSRNYGTYGTSPFGYSTGRIRSTPGLHGIFKRVGEFSSYFQIQKNVSDQWTVGVETGFDVGNLLNNSVGANFKVIRQF